MNEQPPSSNVRQLHCGTRILERAENAEDSASDLPESPECSFCHRTLQDAKCLIGNAEARICDICLITYSDLMARSTPSV